MLPLYKKLKMCSIKHTFVPHYSHFYQRVQNPTKKYQYVPERTKIKDKSPLVIITFYNKLYMFSCIPEGINMYQKEHKSVTLGNNQFLQENSN